jgi:hypothetical protein
LNVLDPLCCTQFDPPAGDVVQSAVGMPKVAEIAVLWPALVLATEYEAVGANGTLEQPVLVKLSVLTVVTFE